MENSIEQVIRNWVLDASNLDAADIREIASHIGVDRDAVANLVGRMRITVDFT